MSATVVFADNCLLINLAHVGRLGLFSTLLGPKMQWTQQVEYETARSVAAVPALGDVYSFMPSPLVPDPRERQDTFAIRTQFAKPGESDPRLHLGEAETCAVIHQRYTNSEKIFFATEDNSAAAYANREGWRVLSTKVFLQIAARGQHLTVAEANADLRSLYVMPRGVRGYPPEIPPRP